MLAIDSEPLLPLDVVPELKVSFPLTPLVPELWLLITTPPLVV